MSRQDFLKKKKTEPEGRSSHRCMREPSLHVSHGERWNYERSEVVTTCVTVASSAGELQHQTFLWWIKVWMTSTSHHLCPFVFMPGAPTPFESHLLVTLIPFNTDSDRHWDSNRRAEQHVTSATGPVEGTCGSCLAHVTYRIRAELLKGLF